MKNKTKTYLLLAAVLCIWGVIGYKIINGLNPEEPQVVAQEYDKTFKPKTIAEIDTFSIKNVERDPFLGTLSSNKKTNFTSKNTKTKVDNIKTIPNIIFGGLIKKQNTTDQVFVLNINNKQHLLKKGQTADSVRLISGNTKEIVVRYQNKSQTIKRQ